MSTNSAIQKASLKTRIALSYVNRSNLGKQLLDGAYDYVLHGFVPIRVEIDWENEAPFIKFLNPFGSYYDFDRWGNIVRFYQSKTFKIQDIVLQYPELASSLSKLNMSTGFNNTQWNTNKENTDIEVLFYHDANFDMAIAIGHASSKFLILGMVPNPIGRVLVTVVERPHGSSEEFPSGLFDEQIAPLLAKNNLALLVQQSVTDNVNSPLVLPNDVMDLPMGPGAVIHTSQPDGVRRLNLPTPSEAIAQQQNLTNEVNIGSRFPTSRNGQMGSGWSTGAGITAGQGGYSGQIAAHQKLFRIQLINLLSICFQIDETLWPDVQKEVRGQDNGGTTFDIKYTPKKDIAGDYTADVIYSFAGGLDFQSWTVEMLQLKGAGLLSSKTIQGSAPFTIDVDYEERQIETEAMRNSLLSAVNGLSGSIPQMVASGQDPTKIILALAAISDGISKGKDLSELILKNLVPPAPPAPPEAPDTGPETPAEDAGEPAGSDPTGGAVSPQDTSGGLLPKPQGQMAGAGGAGAGGTPPDLQTLLSKLTSGGKATTSVSSKQIRPLA